MIDYKKSKAAATTVTQNLSDMSVGTANIYQSVMVISRRANQISVEMKQELNRKLEEFAYYTDNLEEVFENREQIEIAKYYEHLPKPTLIAIHEYLNNEVYFRNPHKERPEDF